MLCTGAWAQNDADVMGEIRGTSYLNKAMGAEASFNNGWRLMGVKEASALVGAVVKDVPSLAQVLKSNIPVFVAMAQDGTANLTVNVGKISVAETLMIAASKDAFVNEYYDRASADLIKSYAAMGFTDVRNTKEAVRFLGQEHPGMRITSRTQNGPMYQKQVLYFTDDYLFNITATSRLFDVTDELLDMFKASE